MIKQSLFKRYLASTLIVSFLFLALGLTASYMSSRIIMRESKVSYSRPFELIYKLINAVPEHQRITVIEQTVAKNGRLSSIEIGLLSIDGEWLVGASTPSNEGDKGREKRFFLDGDGQQRLILRRSLKFREQRQQTRRKVLLNTIFILSSTLIVGILASAILIFVSLRRKAAAADIVIHALRSGNLKARFTIGRMDEIGQTMMRLNALAEDIENLVTNLRVAQSARNKMLQELAHDLRTPIASLNNLIETLSQKRHRLDEKDVDEMFALAVNEVHYFSRLVEDLLFLSQIERPLYRREIASVNMNEVIHEEAVRAGLAFPSVHFELNATDPFVIYGDAHHFRRLFRNALNNAFSFATSAVQIFGERNSDVRYRIVITDDGPGLSQKALDEFGQRKFSRALTGDGPQTRISIGLGAVIMGSIVENYGGLMTMKNRRSDRGDLCGAELTFEWPL